ncbi:MAG: substrate-binding domain-containing protein, partial [Akkermansiaceae bacterium]|nr:substrate-binding domain-containing protein [Akkermansiaceae bacterium]
CGGDGSGDSGDGKAKFAFVTNVADPFWSHAQAGCIAAAKDFDVAVDFEMNSAGDVAGQNKIVENILSKGDYKGIAISCLNPANQTDIINEAAAKMPLICHDSDAPDS